MRMQKKHGPNMGSPVLTSPMTKKKRPATKQRGANETIEMIEDGDFALPLTIGHGLQLRINNPNLHLGITNSVSTSKLHELHPTCSSLGTNIDGHRALGGLAKIQEDVFPMHRHDQGK